MKIEFKKADVRSDLDLVFINEVLEGELHADHDQGSFLFVPTKGDRILLTRVDYTEACKLLSGELSQLYRYQSAQAA